MPSYYKRALSCFICMLTVLLVCGVRVLSVATDRDLTEAAVKQSTRRLDVAENRGTIYDCNGVPLTGGETEALTVVFPTEQGVIALSEMLSGEELTAAAERFKQGTPVIVRGKAFPSDGTEVFYVPQRYTSSLAHLLGYVGTSGHGVTGIEKGLDGILYSGSHVSVVYEIDSTGHMLTGAGWRVDYGTPGGSVTLTIDSEIQKMAEAAMREVPAGAVVVMDAETGKIRAMVSRPDFDRNNVADYLDSEDSPLINRALYAYNVGSVFKPCLAAAALESGLSGYRYVCTGSIFEAGLTFRCNSAAGHGELDLTGALAYSCNTYFYTLGLRLGAQTVYNTAKLFRFGDALDLGGGIVSSGGSLPALSTLTPAALINLSIGQGDLMLSPTAISCMYAAIINGGEYILPSIVERTEKDGVVTVSEPSFPTKVMSEKTAATLKEQLENVLSSGTGSAAYVDGVAAGGKTGTAQTGWKDGDRSILNGWFCGFFEGVTGKYVVTILKEDVKSGSVDCAPVFQSIVSDMCAAKY